MKQIFIIMYPEPHVDCCCKSLVKLYRNKPVLLFGTQGENVLWRGSAKLITHFGASSTVILNIIGLCCRSVKRYQPDFQFICPWC